jgi:hypothetical protein
VRGAFSKMGHGAFSLSDIARDEKVAVGFAKGVEIIHEVGGSACKPFDAELSKSGGNVRVSQVEREIAIGGKFGGCAYNHLYLSGGHWFGSCGLLIFSSKCIIRLHVCICKQLNRFAVILFSDILAP